MGMFDNIRCEYPLPGHPPANAAELDFQTKDLESLLQTYVITPAGVLQLDGANVHFSGTVDFYWSNIVASGPGIYTHDGEDAHHLEYQALFIDGKVTRMEETENRKEPALAFSERDFGIPMLTPEERAEQEKRYAESLLGRTICIWWGGDSSEGYAARVVAESDKELVLQTEAGKFEIIHRHMRDHTFFDSYEDGKRDRDERKADWDRRKAEYEEKVAARNRAKRTDETADGV
jgi:hypothetical protein